MPLQWPGGTEMKYLILLAVILVVGWWTFGRRRPPAAPPRERDASPPDNNRQGEVVAPQPMLVCAHCGVHLPQAEAVLDATERPFCSEAHRLAGPRA